ncbi:hypothetical protein OED52_13650 [Rhodococcus sp. Z13]|uniref:Uncharacterized protein n=1 Tax=Rhodococcus sacchari TaxID=2962047 RepID=A0ACD4DCL2_9NOCA|nr:hypothetical protein [Rhodococcus sp. Z13]UYP17716.1 hypothetical protein OED52_13650 [Rhodococcus sp. Z13]
MRLRTALIAVPAVLALAACGSNDSDTDVAADDLTCPAARTIDDPAVADAINSVQIDGQVTAVRVTTDSDHPGEQGIAIDLCIIPTLSADELRPIATEYAKAIKASPLADTTFAVWVENYAYNADQEIVGDVKLKDPHFQSNLWNGKPSADAENARWEVLTG